MSELPPAPPTVDPPAWETVLDPVEQSFTIAMPRGWQNRAWLVRGAAALHQMFTATSPSGATALYSGDPSLPMFVDPAGVVFGVPPGMVVRPYTSIEHFLPAYVHQRFGGLPGFRVVGMAPSPELFHLVGRMAQRAGATQVWTTAARLAFELDEGPKRVRGLIFGSSTSFAPTWTVEVHGISSTVGDPEAWAPALLGMVASRQATPAMQQRQMQERAMSAARHQATMAQLDQNAAILRANHQQNMSTLQGMAASHQAHMASVHAAHDAHNAGWQAAQTDRDAAHTAAMHRPDDSHRRFLNTIAEERTVVDGEGNTHQVADGYDRYFRRRGDNTWIGTKNHRDLHGLPGVDPNEYEEVRIKV